MRTRSITPALAATAAVALTAAGIGGLSATPAGATAAGVTGAAEIIAAPPSLAKGSTTSATKVRVINEKAAPLGLSLTVGTTVINSGTCVQSHLIHFDTGGNTAVSLSGTATFSQNIVAIVNVNGPLLRLLDNTDSLFGVAGTTYATHNDSGRAIEPIIPVLNPTGDVFTQTDPNAVSFTFRTDGWDEVRVLTTCDPNPVVPESPLPLLLPASAAAVLGGGLLWRRRRPRLA